MNYYGRNRPWSLKCSQRAVCERHGEIVREAKVRDRSDVGASEWLRLHAGLPIGGRDRTGRRGRFSQWPLRLRMEGTLVLRWSCWRRRTRAQCVQGRWSVKTDRKDRPPAGSRKLVRVGLVTGRFMQVDGMRRRRGTMLAGGRARLVDQESAGGRGDEPARLLRGSGSRSERPPPNAALPIGSKKLVSGTRRPANHRGRRCLAVHQVLLREVQELSRSGYVSWHRGQRRGSAWLMTDPPGLGPIQSAPHPLAAGIDAPRTGFKKSKRSGHYFRAWRRGESISPGETDITRAGIGEGPATPGCATGALHQAAHIHADKAGEGFGAQELGRCGLAKRVGIEQGEVFALGPASSQWVHDIRMLVDGKPFKPLPPGGRRP